MRVGTIGPEGTFSDMAAKKYLRGRGTVVYFSSIPLIFEALKKKAVGEAVVPVENSLEGTVGATIDNLFKHDFMIRDELVLDIHHSVAALRGAKRIKRVVSNPQALAQCDVFLRKKFPGADFVPAASTVGAMRELVKKKDLETAVVGPEEAARRLGLKVIASRVEDVPGNKTRFFVIGKKDSPAARKAKTSIIIYRTVDRPGLLYDLLGEFAKRKINLTKIESRPSRKRLGEYIFVIDLEGSRKSKGVREAFRGLERFGAVKILGSYPKRY